MIWIFYCIGIFPEQFSGVPGSRRMAHLNFHYRFSR